MSERYPGGYITKSPPTPTFASAPGIWTLDQAMQYIKEGNWPINGQGYLMMSGVNLTGALDRNSSFDSKPATTLYPQTLYYGPWTGGSYSTSAAQTVFLIRNDGTLWGLGSNQNGRLGIGQLNASISTISYINIPVQIGTSTDWNNAKISLGSNFVISVKNNGTLWAWGDNGSGQLGVGDTVSRSSPVQIGSDTNWKNVSGGNEFWLATKTDGTLWVCGANNSGNIGDNTRVAKSSPIQIGALTDWNEICAGNQTSIAVKINGTLWSWGSNASGRLGQNIAFGINRSSPVQIGALTTWSKIFQRENSVFAITIAGALWAWGENSSGELGIGNTVNRSSPVQVGALTNWHSVYYRGSSGTAALKTDGTLWVWGNSTPAFSSGSTTSSPVQLGSDTDWLEFLNSNKIIYYDGKQSTAYEAILAFKGNKNYAYGSGQPTAVTPGNPISGAFLPTLINTDRWVSVSTNGDATVGIKIDGTLWSWGTNATGVGGRNTGTTNHVSSPVQIGALTNWESTFVAEGVNTQYAYALTKTGELYAWGGNQFGQLGDTSIVNKSSPVQVGALSNWKQISSGVDFAVSIKTDGTIWAWGKNTDGRLGINIASTGNRSSPVQLGALTDWAYVSAGDQHCAAVKTDGTLWVWGAGANGKLGTGNVTTRSSPVQVGALTNWSKVSCGVAHTLAIKTDGTLWAWGEGADGRLGTGNQIDRSSPVQVGALTNWKDVLAMGTLSYAITTTGELYQFGRNNFNTTLSTEIISQSSPVQVGAKSYYLSISNNSANGDNAAAILTRDV